MLKAALALIRQAAARTRRAEFASREGNEFDM